MSVDLLAGWTRFGGYGSLHGLCWAAMLLCLLACLGLSRGCSLACSARERSRAGLSSLVILTS
jgi:hypothetical protein